MFFRNILLFLLAAVIMTDVDAQPKDANYDDAKDAKSFVLDHREWTIDSPAP